MQLHNFNVWEELRVYFRVTRTSIFAPTAAATFVKNESVGLLAPDSKRDDGGVCLLGNDTLAGMKKDFDTWNEKKKQTNDELPRLYTVREMWWCRPA